MIKHNQVYVEPAVTAAVTKAISEGRLSLDEDVQRFERAFEGRFGLEANSCIAVSSGSIALFLLLKCLKKEHHKLEIPRYTCASLTRAALMADYDVMHSDSISNVIPQFADYSSKSNLVVLPHMCGIESIIVSENKNSLCIEDATQILGSRNSKGFSGFSTGLSIVSLYATKSLTTLGQGGMIYARDRKTYDSIRRYISSDSDYSKMGINLRMPGLNAIAGTIALDFIDDRISQRAKIYKQYSECGLRLVSFPDFQVEPNYYRSLLFVPGRALEVTHRLRSLGITAICPYEEHELSDQRDPQNTSNTDDLVNGLVSLPAHKSVSIEEISYISKSVMEIIG